MDSYATLSELRTLLDQRKIGAVELAQHYLDRIKRFNPHLNAYVWVDADWVLETARKCDEQIAKGESDILTGIPIAHKDLFCIEGTPTTACSKMLQSYVAPYTATVVANLSNRGAIHLGKLNMDEFAMGTSNETSVFGPALNPWGEERTPGGSSGGSAVAVAAGLAPAATGSDTGGSIRQPASFCGVTGFKPSYGRNSRYGMIAFASSLDQAGTLNHTAEDAAIMLQAMQGHDRKDSTSVNARSLEFLKGSKLLTIGYSAERVQALPTKMVERIEEAHRVLEKAGHTFLEVELPESMIALATYYVISCAEASSNLSRYDGIRYGYRHENSTDLRELYMETRSNGFGSEVKRRILAGTLVSRQSEVDRYYRQAQKIRRLIHHSYLEVFQTVDLLLTPAAPTTAFRLNEQQQATESYKQDRFTVGANLCGLPAISVPCGLADGLPVGVQFVGPQYLDDRVLGLAIEFQQLTDWHRQHPEID